MAQKPCKTIDDIRAHKNRPAALVCLTAYTAPMAEILDKHCDLFIIGDSVGMVLYGMENTLGVDMEMMIRHGQAVMRAKPRALTVIDMPAGTYEESPEKAAENAERLLRESGCDAVKLEGGAGRAETVARLTRKNIPVMGHIGLLPQSVVKEGGYRIKGRSAAEESRLIDDAMALEESGAFALIIEGTAHQAAEAITRSVAIPTIGIGASPVCDGQVLVSEDMLGMLDGPPPKFVKHYADLKTEIDRAAARYAADVKARKFPGPGQLYKRPAQAAADTKKTGTGS